MYTREIQKITGGRGRTSICKLTRQRIDVGAGADQGVGSTQTDHHNICTDANRVQHTHGPHNQQRATVWYILSS